MFRVSILAALVVCSLSRPTALHAGNTYFWLSTEGFPSVSPLPDMPTEVPNFYNFNGQTTGSIYIWGRPESGETLKNWSLNLVCSDPTILTFNSADIYNAPTTGVTRWEFTSTPIINKPTASTSFINNIAGFILFGGVGQGIGSAVQGDDLYHDLTQDGAWLLAKVNYSLKPFAGYKSANLALQVGTFGVSNFLSGTDTGTLADVDVVFGHSGDTVIDPSIKAQREVSLGAPDGVIKYFDTPDADFDGDTDVDGRDFLIWQRNHGTMSGAPNANGNANPGEGAGQDGAVNAIDLAAWEFQYKTTVNPTLVDSLLAVPEPNSLGLAIWAVTGLLTGRRLRHRNWLRDTSGISAAVLQTKRIHPSVADVTE